VAGNVGPPVVNHVYITKLVCEFSFLSSPSLFWKPFLGKFI
jgi:hypothetical protein